MTTKTLIINFNYEQTNIEIENLSSEEEFEIEFDEEMEIEKEYGLYQIPSLILTYQYIINLDKY